MRLDQFLEHNHPSEYKFLHSLLIFDYLKEQKIRPKIWYEQTLKRSKKQWIFGTLIEQHPSLHEDLLNRYARIEQLDIHPLTYNFETVYFIKLFHPQNQDYFLILEQ